MANYLLLRDNKETGPYSLDELLDLGLKAYDLVWIQNKSAAWRYPSEVDELKAFAPVSEEQPFDRFFKKNIDEKTPAIPDGKEKITPIKKTVFVTLPSPKMEKTGTDAATTAQTTNEYKRIKTITVTENPVSTEMKYSQPLDEIKEMYVKTLQLRKQKIARKNLFIKNLKKASLFIFALTLGVLIGFTLRSKTSKKNMAAQVINSSGNSLPVQTDPSISTPELPIQQNELSSNTEPRIPAEEVEKKRKPNSEEQFEQKSNMKSKHEKISEADTKKEINADQNPPGTDINVTTGERIKKSRNSTDETASASKADISKLVTVKSNDYKRGVFGGIHDLQLTVTNDSKYIIDNVVVALQYIKPSEQPLKTENISFHSIAPNGSMTIAIPSSNRGIKISFKIVKIESKELNRETAGL